MSKRETPDDFIPKTPDEMEACLADPMWRLCSGQLYQIMLKSPDGDDATVVPFKPNRAPRRLIARLWHRNIILKGRQPVFQKPVSILWLAQAFFHAQHPCGK